MTTVTNDWTRVLEALEFTPGGIVERLMEKVTESEDIFDAFSIDDLRLLVNATESLLLFGGLAHIAEFHSMEELCKDASMTVKNIIVGISKHKSLI